MSLENKFDEIKGSVKEGLGKLTGDTSLEVEGLAEQVVSKVKETAEGAKEAVEGAIDSVKDKLK
ncbi:CsbD family protein [Gemella sp.]